jgi:hypothetical protein
MENVRTFRALCAVRGLLSVRVRGVDSAET